VQVKSTRAVGWSEGVGEADGPKHLPLAAFGPQAPGVSTHAPRLIPLKGHTHMPFVLSYLLVVLVGATLLGVLLHRSPIWHLVDVVYYPLAAIGVALLFISNAAQRNLLLIDEQLERNRALLQAITASKPTIDGSLPTRELVDSSFGLIAGIGELADVCRTVPGRNPTCAVATKMGESVRAFLRVANAKYESPEIRIATACRAGDSLIEELRTTDHMSPVVGDELSWQLKDARTRDHYYLDFGVTEREAAAFEIRARARVDSLRKVISDTSDAMEFVFSTYDEEIRVSKTVIHALYPCLSIPEASLEKLAQWSGSRQSQEAALAQLEAERKRVQATPSTSRTVQWMQLNLWPLILIAALALKFSKGIAALRTHRLASLQYGQPPQSAEKDGITPPAPMAESGHPGSEPDQAASVAEKAQGRKLPL
jgi:hypothetical protein